jgi:hypothetical protein
MAQRRNRRKTRTVSDHAILALHNYYLRAEHMRGQYRTREIDSLPNMGQRL